MSEFDFHSQLNCIHAGICPACNLISKNYSEQKDYKVKNLESLWKEHNPTNSIPPIEFHSIGLSAHRDYIDFTYRQQKFGFIKNGEIVPIPECELLNPKLKSIYQQFIKLKFPVEPISFRIRQHQNHHGLWIDTSNINIKTLLDEKNSLQKILDLGFLIEMGQKKKYLTPQTFKLQESILETWSQTQIAPAQIINLYGCISDFTQSGIKATKKINEILFSFLNQISSKNIIEFGSGLGTLTFPLLGENRLVTACEFNQSAITSLKYSLSHNHLNNSILARVQFIEGDHQGKNLIKDFKNYDLITVNPPRSGIKNFLAPLTKENKPKYLIYMSCYPKTFIEDTKKISELGYQCQALDIVDQFPNSTHYEVLSLWIST